MFSETGTRSETSRLGAIPCLFSCLSLNRSMSFVKDGRRKEKGRLSWHWRIIVCLFLVRNTILNTNLPNEIIGRFSILLAADCCIDFFSKHKRRVRKQPLETVLNFSTLFLWKKLFGGTEVRFTSIKCKRDNSFISFIYFLHELLALKWFYPDVSQTFFAVPYRILATEWLLSILTDFILLFKYCIFVICHKKLSTPRLTLWFIFSTWHVRFCHGCVVDMYWRWIKVRFTPRHFLRMPE